MKSFQLSLLFIPDRGGNTRSGSRHPFIDGIIRTARVVAENVLGREGYYIAADEDTIVEFMVAVASYKYDTGEIGQWLKEYAKKMRG
jgi:prophage maintenance system killer protein